LRFPGQCRKQPFSVSDMASDAGNSFNCQDGGVQERRGKKQWKKWAVLCSVTFVLGAAVGTVSFLASPQTSAAGRAMAKDFRAGAPLPDGDMDLCRRFPDFRAGDVPDQSYTSQLKNMLGDSVTVEQLKQQLEEMKEDLDDPELQKQATRLLSGQIMMLRQPENLAKLMKMFDEPELTEVAQQIGGLVAPLANDPKTLEMLDKLTSDPAVVDQVTLLSLAMEDHSPELYKDEKRTATRRLWGKKKAGPMSVIMKPIRATANAVGATAGSVVVKPFDYPITKPVTVVVDPEKLVGSVLIAYFIASPLLCGKKGKGKRHRRFLR